MIINYAKIVDRLERIRKALSFSIIAVLAVTVALYIKADVLIGLLTKPLGIQELVFLTPMEGLITKVKIAFFSALALCLPLVIWQFTRMASPLLPEKQRKAVYLLIPAVTVLFFAGVVFGYQMIIPFVLKFLMSAGEEFMTATLSGNRYFSFIIMLALAMGAIFQLPLVMVALSWVGLLTSQGMRQKRKAAMIGMLLLTGLLIPTPDIFTLLIVSSPVLALYEMSIWIIVFMEKAQKIRNKKLGYYQEV